MTRLQRFVSKLTRQMLAAAYRANSWNTDDMGWREVREAATVAESEIREFLDEHLREMAVKDSWSKVNRGFAPWADGQVWLDEEAPE